MGKGLQRAFAAARASRKPKEEKPPQTERCPVCEGQGSYMLRIGMLQRVKCNRCGGTGQAPTTP